MFAQNLIDNFKEHKIQKPQGDFSREKLTTASPQMMDQLTKEKAYTALAQPVLLYITAHPDISDGAKILWFFLYMETSRFENFTVRYTPSNLAEALSVNERTIQRRLRELEDEYLLRRQERYGDGRQLVNNLTITLPHSVADKMLKHIPNRKKPSVPIRTRQPARYSTESSSHKKPEKPNDPAIQKPWETQRTKPSQSRPRLKDIVSGKVKIDRQTAVDNLKVADRAVTGEDDKTVTQKNNNLINNIKNNSTSTGRRAGRNQRIETHSRKLSLFRDNFSPEKLPLCEIEETIDEVPDSVISKVEQRLKEQGFYGQQLEQLATEIVFSVYQTKTWHCPSAKAVNACLMLIKQNRWRTPAGFKH